MNKTFKNIFTILASALIVAAFAIGFSYFTSKTLADSGNPNTIKTTTSTFVTVGATSTPVIPAGSGRVYAIFVDDSANPIYLSLSGTAVVGSGIRLNASGGSYEINLSNQYIGAVSAIASGSSNLTVTYSQ